MQSEEVMLKVENVSKIYKLGEIGGTTLQESLQRLKAKIRRKEDPTKKIGTKNYNKGETFKALDNVSFDIKKGERIGIIGHNGAGKSTLLKLISRVTGPSEGAIYLNGRIASMLEVGTGFHPELTGRENIYMNGAILGMTKKEIDAKMEDIIEFSEVRQFIDTPVKRYSSGMYVKLAFSVAAHLDSEIMIMDEVLAVGDMTFQKKCIAKMRDVSEENNRTILYVSHNMNTIRQLCNRVIVLDSGHLIFDGDVEKGIKIYLKEDNKNRTYFSDLKSIIRETSTTGDVLLESIAFNSKTNIFPFGSSEDLTLTFKCKKNVQGLIFRINIYTDDGRPIATSHTKPLSIFNSKTEKHNIILHFNFTSLAPGSYYFKIIAFESTFSGTQIRHDVANKALYFDIVDNGNLFNLQWDQNYWGNVVLPDTELTINEE